MPKSSFGSDVGDFTERLIARVHDVEVRFAVEREGQRIVEQSLIAGTAISGITGCAGAGECGDSGILLRSAVDEDGAVAGSVGYVDIACGIDCQVARILERGAEWGAGSRVRGGAIADEIVNAAAGVDGVDAVSAAIGNVENSIVVDDQSAGLNELCADGGHSVRIGDWSRAGDEYLAGRRRTLRQRSGHAPACAM